MLIIRRCTPAFMQSGNEDPIRDDFASPTRASYNTPRSFKQLRWDEIPPGAMVGLGAL